MPRDDKLGSALPVNNTVIKLSELLLAAADAFAKKAMLIKRDCWQVRALQQCLGLHLVHVNHLYQMLFPCFSKFNSNQLNNWLNIYGLRFFAGQPLSEVYISVQMTRKIFTCMKVVMDANLYWHQDEKQEFKGSGLPINGNYVDITLIDSALVGKGNFSVVSDIHYTIKLNGNDSGFWLDNVIVQTDYVAKNMPIPINYIEESIERTEKIALEERITRQVFRYGVFSTNTYTQHSIENDQLYRVLIQPKVPGECLTDYLSQPKFAQQDNFINYIALVNLACGLRRLHAMQITHLDIKPLNIKLGKNAYLIILDFGFSQLGDGITQRRSSILYAAPERLLAQYSYRYPSPVLSPELDIYSFGIIALEMLGINIVKDLVPNIIFSDKGCTRAGQTVSLEDQVTYLHTHMINKAQQLTVPPAMKKTILLMLAKESQNRPTLERAINHLLRLITIPQSNTADYAAYQAMYWHLICTEVFIIATKLSDLNDVSVEEQAMAVTLKEMSYIHHEFNHSSPEKDKIMGQYKYEQLINYFRTSSIPQSLYLEAMRDSLIDEKISLEERYRFLGQILSDLNAALVTLEETRPDHSTQTTSVLSPCTNK